MNQLNESHKSEIKFPKSQENYSEDCFYKRHLRTKNCNSKEKILAQMQNETKNELKKDNNDISMFLKRSSVYALNQIGNSTSTIRRIIWILVLFIGIVGFSWQIWQFFVSYFTYPVVVNIYSVKSKSQQLPSVTICNINSIRKKFKSCFNHKKTYDNCLLYTSEDNIEYIMGKENKTHDETGRKRICIGEFLETYNNTCGYKDLEFSEEYGYYWWRYLFYSINYESVVRYGHQKRRFIRSAILGTDKVGYEEFSVSATFSYGNCYTFKKSASYRNPRNPLIGPDSGLELELDIEIDEYLPFTQEEGARIQIHDSDQPHDIVVHGINIYPGFKTSIAISKFTTERLPAPYPDQCKDYDIGDSEFQCEERCDEMKYLSNCSCSMSKIIYPDIDMCDISKGSLRCCLESLWGLVDACDCPPACKELCYNLQISSAVWPSKAYYETLKKSDYFDIDTNTSIEDFRQQRMVVKVYYNTLDYTITKQNPMFRDSEFLSLVGGQLGLWLGLSLITVFEFLENIFILCKYKLN